MVNYIPLKLTSNNTPSPYIAKASNEYGTNFQAWKAFNGTSSDSTDAWLTSGTSGWIYLYLGRSFIVNKYIISPRNYNDNPSINSHPKDWTFEGSNDGANWVVLDTQVNQTGWNFTNDREYEFNNSTGYHYYKLNIISNNGTNNYTSIGELKLYEKLNVNKFLILSNEEVLSVEKGGYSDNLIPKMTSNTAPSGIASANAVYSTAYEPYFAFDGVLTGYGWQVHTPTTGWLAYEFTEPKIVNTYSLTMTQGTAQLDRSPKDWKLEGTIDGTNWILLDTRTNEMGWTTGEKRTYSFSNNTPYKKYRINISNNNGGSLVCIGEFELKQLLPSTLISVNGTSEMNFINHGLDKSTEIDLNSQMTNKVFIEQTPTTLGSGKVFSKTIDATKTPIKKVSIK